MKGRFDVMMVEVFEHGVQGIPGVYSEVVAWLLALPVDHTSPGNSGGSAVRIGEKNFTVRRVGEMGYLVDGVLQSDAEVIAGVLVLASGLLDPRATVPAVEKQALAPAGSGR